MSTVATSEFQFAPQVPRAIPTGESLASQAAALGMSLRRTMQTGFVVFDGATGRVVYGAADLPPIGWSAWSEMAREVARGTQARFLEEEDPIILHAIPVVADEKSTLVAVGMYVVRPIEHPGDVVRAAEVFGVAVEQLFHWCRGQRPISVATIERMTDVLSSRLHAEARIAQLERENEMLSSHITATLEEITLIYRLTHNLKLSSNREDPGTLALGWLSAVIAAEGFAIHYLDVADQALAAKGGGAGPLHITHGRCPLDAAAFQALVQKLGADATSRPVVLNRPATNSATWTFPEVRELVLVALTEGERTFGWLAAFNHKSRGEFGTVEANLLSSIGTILGIHSSNMDLYRQQSEVLADVVRAMSSAIDAKDPYTRGHSDRVARVCVRLAQELGCDRETARTIYMAGLLHDIGKIGIDDNVLRKPGKLTEAEFEHVKTHVEIGYRILRDLRKMQHMLPVVLHHHESFDGTGYPHGLAGENIPFLARIAAVADAYDAMASDRPYRAGMPDEKLDEVIRQGAGRQWDPRVVEAFFQARDDIRELSHRNINTDELAALQFS
ncbi:MAG TPA: HD-GYP domain-containing protein [Pirellulales bacterium]|nr:HD-GYP domain-containing protein [Pirellulales bacterium]